MIINQNISALSTFNALTKNTKATEKAIGNLSTGRRINSAADDAAGLAITEKMRGQISGLKQSSSNAQNGISLLQTAEGGLDQTHSILQRMRALAVQSATDTNTADDRQKIQGEVDQLAKEISRISNTTEFNTQNLLAGGMSDTFHIGANANQNLSVSVTAMDAQSLGVASNTITAASVAPNSTGLNITSVSRGIAAGSFRIQSTLTAASMNNQVTTSSSAVTNTALLAATAGTSYTGSVDANYTVKIASVTSTGTAAAGSSTVASISYSTDGGTSWKNLSGNFVAGVKVDGMTFKFAASSASSASTLQHYTVGDSYNFSVKAGYDTLQLKDHTAAGVNIGPATIVHKGDTSAVVGDGDSGQTVSLQFTYSKLTSASLTALAKSTTSKAAVLTGTGGVASNATVVAGIDVSTQDASNTAITTIDKAINTVSQQRSQLGAYQNRLTNTIDNLNTSNENITASESRIRDVDMALEMSTYQKNNILQSAATAMLAKANQQPQSVLQLLQG